jgi:hypothetical protein
MVTAQIAPASRHHRISDRMTRGYPSDSRPRAAFNRALCAHKSRGAHGALHWISRPLQARVMPLIADAEHEPSSRKVRIGGTSPIALRQFGTPY